MAENVRDFVVAASPSWTVRSARLGATLVRVYGFPGGNGTGDHEPRSPGTASLPGADGALPLPDVRHRRERRRLGDGGAGRRSGSPRPEPGQLPWLVSHEAAHQWFYGIVGNDQAREPFADEAMADFLARYVTGTAAQEPVPHGTLDRTIYRYSARCYFEVIYVQGGAFLDQLRHRMGPTAFWAGIRDYLTTNRFGLGGTRLLLETLDAHTPLDLLAPLRPRFPRLL